jgi:hypothetical protein
MAVAAFLALNLARGGAAVRLKLADYSLQNGQTVGWKRGVFAFENSPFSRMSSLSSILSIFISGKFDNGCPIFVFFVKATADG